MLDIKPSLILKRHIKAAPAKVYAAWTDPEKIMRWFGSDQGPTLHAETDLRAGGRFRIVFRMIDGEERDVSGAYREVVPGRKLTFTWHWASPREPESLVTIDLEPDGDGTLLTLTHEQIAGDTVHDYRRGWIGALDKLLKLLPDFGEGNAVENQEVRMMPYAGGCSCGAVHYELAAEPIRGFQCQCRDCQRDTGSGHASVMVFPRAAMRISGPVAEISRTADTGAQKLKGFCGSCGSPLYNKPLSKPDMIGIYVGTLDDPSGFKPQAVIFASRGHAWDHLDPALPKLPNMRPSP